MLPGDQLGYLVLSPDREKYQSHGLTPRPIKLTHPRMRLSHGQFLNLCKGFCHTSKVGKD